MNTKIRYAKKGALVVGLPFAAWSLILFFITMQDRSLGSVYSFGVVLPSTILGFPWGLGVIALLAKLPIVVKESVFMAPIGVLGHILIVLSPALNGAIIGYRIGAKKARENANPKT